MDKDEYITNFILEESHEDTLPLWELFSRAEHLFDGPINERRRALALIVSALVESGRLELIFMPDGSDWSQHWVIPRHLSREFIDDSLSWRLPRVTPNGSTFALESSASITSP
ncbi:MAG: hypothetical protein AAF432_09475 [Planctomycetota bacterium]